MKVSLGMVPTVSSSWKISAVIPTYNRRDRLQRALDSVVRQSLSVEEIILVDDGSTDGTADFVRNKFPSVTVIEQENQGVSAARNVGIQAATTSWIAFLDSDDVWLSDKLEKQVNLLKQYSDSRICHTEEKWLYRREPKSVAKPYVKQGGWIFERCLPVCAISPSTVLIHKSVFETVGLFDVSLAACEDYDLWLRICSRMPVVLVEEPLIEKHGGHSDQLSSQWGLDKWRIQALQKLLKENHLSEEQRSLVIQQLKQKCSLYAQGLEKHGKGEAAKMYKTIAETF